MWNIQNYFSSVKTWSTFESLHILMYTCVEISAVIVNCGVCVKIVTSESTCAYGVLKCEKKQSTTSKR